MKKTLTVLFILCLLLGGTIPARAAEPPALKVTANSRLFVLDKDREVLIEAEDGITIEPGDAIYIELLSDVGSITPKIAEGYKIIADLAQGAQIVERTAIENHKALVSAWRASSAEIPAKYGLAQAYRNAQECGEAVAALRISPQEKKQVLEAYQQATEAEFKYFAVIQTVGWVGTAGQDLYGTIKAIKRTAGNMMAAETKILFVPVAYATIMAGSAFELDNTAPVVDFAYVEDEAEMLFGSAASFTVNVRDQDKLFLGYSMRPDLNLLAQNPNADIIYIDFLAKPSFNRIGDLRFFSFTGKYFYTFEEGKLEKLAVVYDKEYDAFLIKTRRLSTYVISDVPLVYNGAGSAQ